MKRGPAYPNGQILVVWDHFTRLTRRVPFVALIAQVKQSPEIALKRGVLQSCSWHPCPSSRFSRPLSGCSPAAPHPELRPWTAALRRARRWGSPRARASSRDIGGATAPAGRLPAPGSRAPGLEFRWPGDRPRRVRLAPLRAYHLLDTARRDSQYPPARRARHGIARCGSLALAAAASPRGGRAEAGVALLPHLNGPYPHPPDRAALRQAPVARDHWQGVLLPPQRRRPSRLANLGAERGAER